ncbi:helix-turn-helix domain-containing protein [Corynebacterium poyangense]|uniref:Helix-turn-helix domain-containing protein n=1 Tax=Corynebacterium poyangense TaxID=2684405 RepID=A0A7H0SM68_9CORY|nr:IclR family transcriptional regulator [Corynebacterium poyangense]QNQ89643.1 helix-turn-helix domain-containing protein [Corynebacterium poyangense]
MSEGSHPKVRGSLEKSIDIIKVFRDTPHGLGVSEVARRSGIPKSTAHRILAIMVQEELLERTGNTYRLGPLPFELVSGSNLSSQARLAAETLTPFLAALFEQSRKTVHLAYLSGTEVVYINKLFSFSRFSLPSRIGGRAPAYCTGVGKILLAYSDYWRSQVLTQELAAWTPHTITNTDQLEKELIEAKLRGYACDNEEIQSGLSCIAAPVFGHGPEPVAAFSVSTNTAEFRPDKVLPLLLKVCQSASRAMRDSENRLRHP